MRETKEIGLLLWVGSWTVVGLTAACLVLAGAGLHHVLIAAVAAGLAYAPSGIARVLDARRRSSVGRVAEAEPERADGEAAADVEPRADVLEMAGGTDRVRAVEVAVDAPADRDADRVA